MSKMSTHISSIVRPTGPLRPHLLDDEVFWVEREKKEGGSAGIRTRHLWIPTYETYQKVS